MARERRSVFATVLFTDIVGSTDRLASLGNRRWQVVIEEHNARLRGALRRSGGRELNTAGDAFVAMFADPASAVKCAWESVAAIRELGLALRCGVHLGQVEGIGGAAGGLTVHVAARIAAGASPEEIRISASVHDALAGAGFGFVDCGVFELKGVPGEWRLYGVRSLPAPDELTGTPSFQHAFRTRRSLIGAGAMALLILLAALYVARDGPRSAGRRASATGRSEPRATTAGSHSYPAASHRQVTFLGSVSDAAISPDGKTVAYVAGGLGAEQRLMVQDLAGGEPFELVRKPYIFEPRWAPNGSELLFKAWSDSTIEVFLVPRLGGNPRRMRVADGPSWSPDGSRIVSTNHERLGFTTRATNDLTFLSLPDLSRLSDLDWSPTGTHLAVLARRGDQHGIWTVRTDGRDLHRLVIDNLPLYSPRWSPAGDAVYYLRDLGQTQDLMKVPVSAAARTANASVVLQSGLQVARHHTTGTILPFTISREGGRILYTRGLESSNLWLADRERTTQELDVRQLTNSTAPKWLGSISPDGKGLVFAEGDERSANVFAANLSEGAVRQVTFMGGTKARPVWSPDGRTLAFGARDAGTHKVWLVDAAGGTPRVLENTRMSDDFLGFLAWAPGDDLLYQAPGSRNFVVLDTVTEEERGLVANDSVGWMFSAQVAPTGDRVAVVWNRDEGPGLWVVSMAGETQTRLGEGDYWPVGWSSDGAWVYAWKNGERQIVRLPLRGGPAEEVLQLPCPLPVRWVAMAPDARRFVCNVLESRYDLWLMENFEPNDDRPQAER